MKFRLRGNQEILLTETAYFKNGWSEKEMTTKTLPEPKDGWIHWDKEDLKELAAFADAKAETLLFGGNLDPALWAEARSFKAMARRIRQAIARSESR